MTTGREGEGIANTNTAQTKPTAKAIVKPISGFVTLLFTLITTQPDARA